MNIRVESKAGERCRFLPCYPPNAGVGLDQQTDIPKSAPHVISKEELNAAFRELRSEFEQKSLSREEWD